MKARTGTEVGSGAATVALASHSLLLVLALEVVFSLAFVLTLPSLVDHRDMWRLALGLTSKAAMAGAIAFVWMRGVTMSWVAGRALTSRWELVRATLIGSLAGATMFALLRVGEFESARGSEQVLSSAHVLAWASAVIAAPLLEELLFRGILLRALLRRSSTPAAIIASALVFSAFHYFPVRMVSSLALGVLVGAMLVRTGSVWPCVAAHAAWNLTARVLKLFEGTREVTTSEEFDPLGMMLPSLAVTAALVAGLLVLARSDRRAAGNGE